MAADIGEQARLAAVAAVAMGDEPPAPEPAPAPAPAPAPEPIPHPVGKKSEFTVRVQNLVDSLAQNNPVFKDLQLRVSNILTGTGSGTMSKFMKDIHIPEELQPAMESTLSQMGINGEDLRKMSDNSYITVNDTPPGNIYTSGVIGTLYIYKENGLFKWSQSVPDGFSSVKNISTDAGNITRYTFSLFEFVYKQVNPGSTSRHRIPHRPAKKTKRHSRR